MKHQRLSEKVANIKAASEYEHKLIDSIYNIMVMKRKAEHDYQFALENINR